MRTLLAGFVLFLTIIFASIGAIVGWSLLLGWLLTQILSFSLFEGTLLAMIASAIGAYVLSNTAKSLTTSRMAENFEDEFDLEHHIPPDRFYKTDANKTWENWFKFVVANSIHAEFQHSLPATESMNENQLQELAIRLAEISAALLKAKSSRKTRQLTVTPAALRQQMMKMDLKPYDNDILESAAIGVNIAVTIPPVELVPRAKLWDKLTSLFDVEDLI